MNLLVACIYNLVILGGTAYLVAEKSWSGWWFLLAIACCATISRGNKDE